MHALYPTIEANLCQSSVLRLNGLFRQISLRSCSVGNMNCDNGGSSPSGNMVIPSDSIDTSSFSKSGTMSEISLFRPRADDTDEKGHIPRATCIDLSSKHGYFGKRKTKIDLKSERTNFVGIQNESCLPTQFGKKSILPRVKRSKSSQSYWKGSREVEPFDICSSNSRNSGVSNRNKEEFIFEETKRGVLRPGMVLLKHYMTHDCQVEIVKICRELGLGLGGFYRPGYRDGAKLRLQMMCLGLDWNPETRNYEDRRRIDGCFPPRIPCEFSLLVKRAIQDAHALIEQDLKLSSVEDMLPAMSPNICIVNFYTTSGRLGLHQDRDESQESLSKGLPVVSLSVGDSSEFLYGDHRDVHKAEKVILESGDVLIFGGESRHIFHGVTSIIPNTAPIALLEESSLRPGRLNLTFRQF